MSNWTVRVSETVNHTVIVYDVDDEETAKKVAYEVAMGRHGLVLGHKADKVRTDSLGTGYIDATRMPD